MKSNKKKNLISIKVKTLNHSVFEIFADPEQPIFTIQGQIEKKTSVPVAAQRLLFRGVHLEPTVTFKDYSIEENSVISLIANKIPSEVSQQSSMRKSEVHRMKSITKQHFKYKKHMYLQQRSGGFRIPLRESLETLAQNKNTISQLLDCLNYNYAQESVPFRLENRKLKVGEWIDVRDMSGQWTEAQIISHYNEYVNVHYNGWPERMNEWIAQTSERIMPFRSRTVQSEESKYLSPFPKYQAKISKDQNRNFQPQVEGLINDVTAVLEKFTKTLKELQLEERWEEVEIENAESIKNMSNNAENAENIQINMKDIDEVELDKKEEYYTPSKEIRANDNLSNKAEDDVSKCDKDDISQKSNKSFKSKRSEGLVDTQSMRSLIIDDKKRTNKIFFDNTEAQSVKSVKNKYPPKYHYYNQQYIVEESDSQLNEPENENIITFRKKEYKRKMIASQLAPLSDRFGRLLVDLAPHLALLGYQEQAINNFSQNLSTFTNEGSLESKIARAYQKMSPNMQQHQSQQKHQENGYCQFQIPVMLTPSQLSRLTKLLQEEKKQNLIS